MSTGSLSPSTSSRRAGVGARTFGLLLLAAAAAAGWFFVLRPLRLAEVGAGAVDFTPRAFLFAPLAAVGGLALVCSGGRVLPLMSRPPRGGREVAAVLGLFALAAVLGVGGWWWTDERLHALGYAGW